MADERLPARPAWEADFPIERVEAQHVSRREFAKFLVVVSGGMTLGSAVIAVKDDLIVDFTEDAHEVRAKELEVRSPFFTASV